MEWIGDLAWLRKHHVLPTAGGMLDQDPRFLEAVSVIEDEQVRTAAAVAAASAAGK